MESPSSDPITLSSDSAPQSPQFTIGKMKVDLKSEDDKVKKRQVRLLKNRQSAALSRNRKKEYIANLESKAQELTHSTQELHMQYSRLSTASFETKNRLEYLEKSLITIMKENEFLKSKFDEHRSNINKNNSTLNNNNNSNNINNNNSNKPPIIPHQHHSRHVQLVLNKSDSPVLVSTISSSSSTTSSVSSPPSSSSSSSSHASSSSSTSSPTATPTTLIKEIEYPSHPPVNDIKIKDREREILIGVNKINHFKFNNNNSTKNSDCNINSIINEENNKEGSSEESSSNFNHHFSGLSFSNPNVNSQPIYLTRARSSSYHPSNISQLEGSNNNNNNNNNHHHNSSTSIPTESLLNATGADPSPKLPSLYHLTNNLNRSPSKPPSNPFPLSPLLINNSNAGASSNDSAGSSSPNYRASIIGLSKLKHNFNNNNNNSNNNNLPVFNNSFSHPLNLSNHQ